MKIAELKLKPAPPYFRNGNNYKFNGQELQEEFGLNVTAMDYRQYDMAIGRFNSIDLLSELTPSKTPNHFSNNNPVFFADPSGLTPSSGRPSDTTVMSSEQWLVSQRPSDSPTAQLIQENNNRISKQHNAPQTGSKFEGRGKELFRIFTEDEKTIYAHVYYENYFKKLKDVVEEISNISFKEYLGFADKQLNGSVGLIAVGLKGYDVVPNHTLRHYAYKLSKAINVKPGKIYQKSKTFVKSTGRFANRLGIAGSILTAGTIVYDVAEDGNLNPSSALNATLLVVGLACPVTAPFLLAYGVADYMFGLSDKIDANIKEIHIYDK